MCAFDRVSSLYCNTRTHIQAVVCRLSQLREAAAAAKCGPLRNVPSKTEIELTDCSCSRPNVNVEEEVPAHPSLVQLAGTFALKDFEREKAKEGSLRVIC